MTLQRFDYVCLLTADTELGTQPQEGAVKRLHYREWPDGRARDVRRGV